MNARKDALVKNLSTQPSSNDSKIVEQVLAKIDSISKKIDQKASKTKHLQNLLDQFNTNYEKLSLHCKRLAFKLDNIDISTGQLCDSTKAASANKPSGHHKLPTNDSLNRSLQLIDEMRSDLEQNEVQILDKLLKPCLEQLESQFSGDLLSTDKLDALNTDLNELRCDIEQLGAACDQKWADLNHVKQCFEEYVAKKGDFEVWLNTAELKINKFDPVAIDLEVVEKQFEQLQQAMDDYDGKSQDLDNLNRYLN